MPMSDRVAKRNREENAIKAAGPTKERVRIYFQGGHDVVVWDRSINWEWTQTEDVQGKYGDKHKSVLTATKASDGQGVQITSSSIIAIEDLGPAGEFPEPGVGKVTDG